MLTALLIGIVAVVALYAVLLVGGALLLYAFGLDDAPEDR